MSDELTRGVNIELNQTYTQNKRTDFKNLISLFK
jgi:hypothetical protein